jgi:cytochrome d ubiquinol oxidase subunit I
MNYPVWDVPIIGSGWVIGIIAILHTLISQFAVGGGLYLALAEHRALKDGRLSWFPMLQKHSNFS